MKSTQIARVSIFLFMLVQIDGHIDSLSPPCGRRLPNIHPLIVNGTTANRHWPWHAAIYHVTTSELIPVYEYKCGGSLISSKWILTAAHCVSHYEEPLRNEQVSVSLGKLNLSEKEIASAQYLNVKSSIHP